MECHPMLGRASTNMDIEERSLPPSCLQLRRPLTHSWSLVDVKLCFMLDALSTPCCKCRPFPIHYHLILIFKVASWEPTHAPPYHARLGKCILITFGDAGEIIHDYLSPSLHVLQAPLMDYCNLQVSFMGLKWPRFTKHPCCLKQSSYT